MSDDKAVAINIEVKFFASCREVVGINSCEMTLQYPSNKLINVINNILELYPLLEDNIQEVSIAVNKKYINDKEHIIKDGDIIALIPPISGG